MKEKAKENDFKSQVDKMGNAIERSRMETAVNRYVHRLGPSTVRMTVDRNLKFQICANKPSCQIQWSIERLFRISISSPF